MSHSLVRARNNLSIWLPILGDKSACQLEDHRKVKLLLLLHLIERGGKVNIT
jgi:hypothetical protein